MVRIFYKSGIYSYGYQADSFEKNGAVDDGMVATFCGNRQVKKCDSLSRPIGIFMTTSTPSLFAPSDTITLAVLVGQGEYAVDVYEDGDYKINDLLYCSDRGMITNQKIHEKQPIIGIVNLIDDNEIGFITSFSNLEHARY